MDLGLQGAAAFVAAASQGMGRAIAERFAMEGADVGMCARRDAELRAAAAVVAEHGTRVVARVADVSDADDIHAAVEAVATDLGRLDCLVVNAGGPPAGTFDTLDDDDWLAAHELTVMSAVRLVRAALPSLRMSDRASVTIVSSHTVREPMQGLLLSNSLRLAVAGLAKTLSNELGPRVRVNTLLPGTIDTARHRALAQRAADAEGVSLAEHDERAAARLPLRRLGTADEFARVAVFLASPAAAYVTGQALAVDGGLIASPL